MRPAQMTAILCLALASSTLAGPRAAASEPRGRSESHRRADGRPCRRVFLGRRGDLRDADRRQGRCLRLRRRQQVVGELPRRQLGHDRSRRVGADYLRPGEDLVRPAPESVLRRRARSDSAESSRPGRRPSVSVGDLLQRSGTEIGGRGLHHAAERGQDLHPPHRHHRRHAGRLLPRRVRTPGLHPPQPWNAYVLAHDRPKLELLEKDFPELLKRK